MALLAIIIKSLYFCDHTSNGVTLACLLQESAWPYAVSVTQQHLLAACVINHVNHPTDM